MPQELAGSSCLPLVTDAWKGVCGIVTDKELSQRAKDYFAQIRKTDRLIQRLTDTVNTLRSSLTSQSYELKPDKVQTSGPKDTLGGTIVKIMSLEDNINTRIDELVQQKADAMRRIQNVPDQDQQNILIARYVNRDKWEKIAVELNFSIAQIYRIHGAALLDFIKENPDILKVDSK
ncbi:hypothetical protein B5F10_18615 [Anaerotruncus colihominis]|uniref:DUF1492 domain-containing protein n=1 Tax=Anaerotruncus colihominis TaxID=169435 RepID=A0A1Y4MPW3_9FIRM|nr:hypothetical protein B5F11_18700 [Anaerotruncus colihominis]OUP70756.1 hypothetical protein B5F10_18615 [Anaerotruncus colihominis]